MNAMKVVLTTVLLALLIPSDALSQTTPSSKAAAKINKFVPLYVNCGTGTFGSVDTCGNDTGWVPVQLLYIRTANQKDLAIDTSFECGLTTFTKVSGKNGDGAVSLAAGRIRVRIGITDVDNAGNAVSAERYAEPTGLGGREGVVYCSRLQALAGVFNGTDCTADQATGVVTCEDPEFIALLLKTLQASSFNFLAADQPSGLKRIIVYARGQAVDAAFAFGDEGGGRSFSEAWIGLGSTLVEEVRLIKGAQVIDVGD